MMSEKMAKIIFNVAEMIYKIWEKVPKTKIMNQESTINVMSSSVDYSIAVKIPDNFRSFQEPIRISHPAIIRLSLSCLSPLPRTITGVIKYVASNQEYILYPELLPSDCEILSLNVTYKLDSIDLIEDFVDRSHTHDPGGPERNEYWMHAQLKHPKVLIEKFGRFDVRDIDVTVGVNVLQELNIAIPNPFINRLKTFFEILNQKDPRQQWKAIPKLRSLSKSNFAGKELEILKNIESLFLPGEFCRFVEVQKDFRYSSCSKGNEAYELPIDAIPKTMDIISRSDLTLEKPATEGLLIYKENLFKDSLIILFE